jgi:hypothetical protein
MSAPHNNAVCHADKCFAPFSFWAAFQVELDLHREQSSSSCGTNPWYHVIQASEEVRGTVTRILDEWQWFRECNERRKEGELPGRLALYGSSSCAPSTVHAAESAMCMRLR